MLIIKTFDDVTSKDEFRAYLDPHTAENDDAVYILFNEYVHKGTVSASELESWKVEPVDGFLIRQLNSCSEQTMRELILDMVKWSINMGDVVSTIIEHLTHNDVYFLDVHNNRTFESNILYRSTCYR